MVSFINLDINIVLLSSGMTCNSTQLYDIHPKVLQDKDKFMFLPVSNSLLWDDGRSLYDISTRK